MKTHSGAKKRFKLTKGGKILHKKAGARHLLIGMSASRGRSLRKKAKVSASDLRRVRVLLR